MHLEFLACGACVRDARPVSVNAIIDQGGKAALALPKGKDQSGEASPKGGARRGLKRPGRGARIEEV